MSTSNSDLLRRMEAIADRFGGMEAIADLFERLLALAVADYLPIKEAATLTHLSPSHIRRAIKSGELPASNCGTSAHPLWRIARADLSAWMAMKKGEAPKVPPRADLDELVRRHLPGLRGRNDSATR